MTDAMPNYGKPTYDQVWELFLETDRRFKETERFIKEIGKKTGALDHRFGELAEHLVGPGHSGEI
ncbi:MAG: hypothetical protein LBP29_06885 [Treponema sp.]|jgi:hypothetical protein|nr:hypothetical protein [Treponema sp.]